MTRTILDRRHWVFDLDGTLTVAVHDFAAIRSELCIPPGSDILGHLESLPKVESKTLHERLQQIELELAHRTEAALGAAALIEELYTRDIRLGILTRNTRDNALRTLDLIGLGGYFEYAHVLGRDEALPKPDPDGLHRLAALWGASPNEMVMVGDYLYDLQAGRSAGTLTVHVDVSREFRWPDFADITIESLQEMAVYLATT